MTPITIERFTEYFAALHGGSPYDWQSRLAKRAAKGDWPGAIDLPTGSGKTSCIDIAVFALACQAHRKVEDRVAPRRILFCVNRRVIVDEAHQRAVKIARKIWEAERANADNVLRDVAAALRTLAGASAADDIPPLDVLELRGGIFRDNRWARSATQPTIVCTTVDQLGSRLLFRGYGVSSGAAPIQAALTAYDSMIVLDEAHISKPFLQTLQQTQRYLNPKKWAKEDIGLRPVVVVPMTATPPDGVDRANMIELSQKDRQNKGLDKRLRASKPTKLRAVPDIAKGALEEAKRLARGNTIAIGIIVNRVATAKAIYAQLKQSFPDAPDTVVELVIGSMRPIDRDEQAMRLSALVGSERPDVSNKASFIIATQCLEVGADYDFDALITECASLDALRQRFGRLNRRGRDIIANAMILMAASALKPKKPDPIYGTALPATWSWLVKKGDSIDEDEDQCAIDFGIDAFKAHQDGNAIPTELLAPSASLEAPIMLPAYVDFWCQTAPKPMPDPDVAMFLHGDQRSEPDIQVCWRADLVEDGFMTSEDWCDVVSLLPPTSAECMSVPISRLRKWLAHESGLEEQSDLLGTVEQELSGDEGRNRRAIRPQAQNARGVVWRAVGKTDLLSSATDVRPGDTLVLSVASGGWEALGHIPGQTALENGDTATARIDVAEQAFRKARDRAVLRLHPSLACYFPDVEPVTALFKRIADKDDPLDTAELKKMLLEASDAVKPFDPILGDALEVAKLGLVCEPYPDDRGFVLRGRKPIGHATDWFLPPPPLDDGDDERSRTRLKNTISLADHTAHVREAVDRVLPLLPASRFTKAFRCAVDLHDYGKVDERFQAMLRQSDRTDSYLLTAQTSAFLAKSAGVPRSLREKEAARSRAGLPKGFRHEMLSVQIAESSDRLSNPGERDLILHLIAAHHGHARPFAPVVLDDEVPEIAVEGIVIDANERRRSVPHRLDSGVAERFWALTRRYGWWGLAYFEALVRLSDQQASSDEDAGRFNDNGKE